MKINLDKLKEKSDADLWALLKYTQYCRSRFAESKHYYIIEFIEKELDQRINNLIEE